ncbi:hypothetical protein B0O99DRAFT_670682 [Bisporella sp. PMI_857]|nr:hypothetical protein B0O99DRAFT_670682 [Bisporella sp. PMI_857]
MADNIKRVAVIGAGVSGLTSARHLRSRGLEVVIYERSSNLGGVWSYDERLPPEPTYPSEKPSTADFVLNSEGKSEPETWKKGTHDFILRRAPPGPAYDGLKTNISTVLQELKGHPWKKGTPDFVNVRVVGEYLQSYAAAFDLTPCIRFETRVERLHKEDKKWKLQSSTLIVDSEENPSLSTAVEEFDAVVAASGHYHACRIPNTPGLKEWKEAFPGQVQHSKQYRKPDEFKDQNVLIIGAGVSSTDIAREIFPIAGTIYQSSRGSIWDLPVTFLPPTTTRVAEVASFSPPPAGRGSLSTGIVTLKDGTQLTGIDRVIISTGYHITYPYLPHLHSDTTPLREADEKVLVTDGTQVHNLHKDIFYIPDPTLAFVGTSYYVATFTLFEFQAIAVAAVFASIASLPSESEMRKEYVQKVKEKGYGRDFHSLKGVERAYVDELVAWINSGAGEKGVQKVEGHSLTWVAEEALRMEKIMKNFQNWQTVEKLGDQAKGVKDSWLLEEKLTASVEA